MSEMSVKEAYGVLQAACGIKVGDKVRILMKPTPCKDGWGYFGDGVYEADVGHSFKVEGVSLDKTAFILPRSRYLPFYCLELVEKAPKAPSNVSFEKDGLTVGGTFVSLNTIRRNLDF